MVLPRSSLELVGLGGNRAIAAGGATSGSSTSALDSMEYFNGTTWTTLTAKLSAPRWMFGVDAARRWSSLVRGRRGVQPDDVHLVRPRQRGFLHSRKRSDDGHRHRRGNMNAARWAQPMVTTIKGALTTGGLTTTSTSGSETTSSDLFNTAVGGSCAGGPSVRGRSCAGAERGSRRAARPPPVDGGPAPPPCTPNSRNPTRLGISAVGVAPRRTGTRRHRLRGWRTSGCPRQRRCWA